MKVNGKTKIYHANLINRYFEKEEDITDVTIKILIDVTGITVIDVELEESDLVTVDLSLLDLI